MLDDNGPASGAVRPRLSVIVCSPGRRVRFPTGPCADVSKSGAPLLGSPSFSILLLKAMDLTEDFGSATMYAIVAPHA